MTKRFFANCIAVALGVTASPVFAQNFDFGAFPPSVAPGEFLEVPILLDGVTSPVAAFNFTVRISYENLGKLRMVEATSSSPQDGDEFIYSYNPDLVRSGVTTGVIQGDVVEFRGVLYPAGEVFTPFAAEAPTLVATISIPVETHATGEVQFELVSAIDGETGLLGVSDESGNSLVPSGQSRPTGDSATVDIKTIAINEPPELALTFPAANPYRVGNNVSGVDISGTAFDDESVAEVRIVKNGEPSFLANGTTTWNATIGSLEPGNNTVQVTAIDNVGSPSLPLNLVITRLEENPADLMVLTEFQDVWGSRNEIGVFDPPIRLGPTGFQHFIPEDQKTMAGEINGDGVTDLVMVTDRGEVWGAKSQLQVARGLLGPPFFAPTELLTTGFGIDEANGRIAFVGQFDDSELDDVLRVDADGIVHLAANIGGVLASPVPVATVPLRHDSSSSRTLFAHAMTPGGPTSLLELHDGALTRISSSNSFAGPTVEYGDLGLRHEPENGFGIHFGDFDGDGFADVAQVNPDGTVEVALLTESDAGELQDWGLLGFHDDPSRGKGWWVFVVNADGERGDDLVQLNEFGEVWIALSREHAFMAPYKDAALGFEHKPNGRWQVFPSRLGGADR